VRLVLVGPPGSGKGTQGPMLADHLGVAYLSTGDLLRREVDSGTALGRRVAALIDRGELVPDDLMIAVLAAALGDDTAGYVLDGFPRTVAQAEVLEAGGTPLPPPDAAVHLDVPDAVLLERLAGRAGSEGRADDADPDVIERRLRVYHDETEPLVGHYRERGALVTIDGDGTPDEVGQRLLDAVGRRRDGAGAGPRPGEPGPAS
jgi:adenylate kinase